MIIAVDFDGTCVKHKYPLIGEDIGAIPVLKELIDNGHQLILWTMRSGKELDEAIYWFETNEIPLYGINTNSEQSTWTSSPKCYAQLYIDDAALGCPCLVDIKLNDEDEFEKVGKSYVDWEEVRRMLVLKQLIEE